MNNNRKRAILSTVGGVIFLIGFMLFLIFLFIAIKKSDYPYIAIFSFIIPTAICLYIFDYMDTNYPAKYPIKEYFYKYNSNINNFVYRQFLKSFNNITEENNNDYRKRVGTKKRNIFIPIKRQVIIYESYDLNYELEKNIQKEIKRKIY